MHRVRDGRESHRAPCSEKLNVGHLAAAISLPDETNSSRVIVQIRVGYSEREMKDFRPQILLKSAA
jgi:hypothetical protein